ncbi:26S proteasome non-ATPase regulatory subunit 11 [Trichostrongylus colubriformis]|uniref:26S proteasome non-ATPase regulatory subunit 11 n=1 Tax=Trichostrongylus colubriformis TaxID=6319 RepID=A0AAN8F442_TRICO
MASEPMTLQGVEEMVSHKSEDHQYTEEELKECEDRLVAYAKKLSAEGNVADLRKLIVVTRPFYDVLGKAKASKLIRVLMEYCLVINQENNEKVKLVKDCIEWATANSRLFLRRTLQARLIRLYNDIGQYVEAQKIAGPLTAELKKMEDRELIMEVTLEESKSAFALKNFGKAKTSLVMARSNSNGAYVSTQMQAALDLQSGILYSADEKDFKTAYSYCYEALEGFLIADPPKAVTALKYMCLCKIMLNEAEAIPLLLSSKVIQPVRGRDIDAMKSMAEAFTQRSLSKFNKCLKTYNRELLGDQVVAAHSRDLRDSMLEKEISRVIEPYSEIDLTHIVRCVGMHQKQIEKAISMMLLDKKIFGVIDQHNGTVRVYQTPHKDKTYQKSVELIRALSKTVDAIYARAGNLMK